MPVRSDSLCHSWQMHLHNPAWQKEYLLPTAGRRVNSEWQSHSVHSPEPYHTSSLYKQFRVYSIDNCISAWLCYNRYRLSSVQPSAHVPGRQPLYPCGFHPCLQKHSFRHGEDNRRHCSGKSL